MCMEGGGVSCLRARPCTVHAIPLQPGGRAVLMEVGELGETQAWLRGSQGAGKKSIIIL